MSLNWLLEELFLVSSPCLALDFSDLSSGLIRILYANTQFTAWLTWLVTLISSSGEHLIFLVDPVCFCATPRALANLSVNPIRLKAPGLVGSIPLSGEPATENHEEPIGPIKNPR